MKFKKSAIALAMAGMVAAPMAAQAGGDDHGLYASVRIGLQNLDTGGDSDLTVRGFSSRFGFKGETDLGNGMTGFGKFEWKVRTESGGTAPIERRHATVGVKGDFGKVYMGQTSQTFYNMLIAPTDSPWWGSGYKVVRYGIRTPQGLSYAGDFGAVSFGITAYLDSSGTDSSGDAEMPDGLEAAVAFDAGPVRVAIGLNTAEGVGGATIEDITAVAVYNIALGSSATLGFNYMTQDTVTGSDTSLTTEVVVGNIYVHIEQLSLESDSVNGNGTAGTDPTSITLGYTQNLGPQTLAWYEYQMVDEDTGVSNDDADIIRAVLKYAF